MPPGNESLTGRPERSTCKNSNNSKQQIKRMGETVPRDKPSQSSALPATPADRVNPGDTAASPTIASGSPQLPVAAPTGATGSPQLPVAAPTEASGSFDMHPSKDSHHPGGLRPEDQCVQIVMQIQRRKHASVAWSKLTSDNTPLPSSGPGIGLVAHKQRRSRAARELPKSAKSHLL